MKPGKISAICALIVLIISTAAFVDNRKASKAKSKTDYSKSTANSFAILELFTSEGCSSCPAADELLAKVQKEVGDKQIYVLAYHVDYWNRLGWKDSFSKAQFSKRQYQYSRQFAGQVYTPQVIINGKAECIGSDEPALKGAIQEAFETSGTVSLNFKGQQQSSQLNLDYQFSGNTNNSQLLIALVQKHAVSKVAAGENKGRTLAHAQIVRDLYTIDLPPSKKGTASIDLPTGFNTQDWEVIGLIQNSVTGEITAANRAAIGAAYL